MELHIKYLEKVEHIDRQIEQQKKSEDRNEDDDDEEEAEENYLKRLSGGLFTLQLVDYIILEIAVSADGSKIKERIQKILNLRGSSLKVVKEIMREYIGNLGNASSHSSEWQEQEKRNVLSLINRF
jgi:beta-catenin-like protein 1